MGSGSSGNPLCLQQGQRPAGLQSDPETQRKERTGRPFFKDKTPAGTSWAVSKQTHFLAKVRDNRPTVNKETDAGIRKENLERKPEREFGYAGLNDKIENSQSATGLERGGRSVGYQHKITTALSVSSTKSELLALGNTIYAASDHQHCTLQ